MEYGKFNSAEELLKGYNELEKSFTHKCQQLAELQKQIETKENNNQQAASGTNENSSPLNKQDDGAAMEVQVACAVPADVDATPAANDSPNPQQPLPKVMTSGGNVSLVLPSKPKTIKEASLLAKQLFDGV